MAQTTLDQRMLGVGTALTDHTITASDVITFADVGDSNLTKKDTVQGVLDLAGGGKIAQVVQSQTASIVTTSSSISHDNTIPQITEGAEVLTCAITPTNASSTLFIFVDLMCGTAGGNVGTVLALFKDSTANAIEAKILDTGQNNYVHSDAKFIHKISAGSTSAQTFRARVAAAGSGTVGINSYNASDQTLGGVMKSSILIMEVSP